MSPNRPFHVAIERTSSPIVTVLGRKIVVELARKNNVYVTPMRIITITIAATIKPSRTMTRTRPRGIVEGEVIRKEDIYLERS